MSYRKLHPDQPSCNFLVSEYRLKLSELLLEPESTQVRLAVAPPTDRQKAGVSRSKPPGCYLT